MRLRGRWLAAPLRGVAIAAVIAIAGPALTSTAAKGKPECHGKPATYVGTNGTDRVRDDSGKDPKLGLNPVLVLRGGDDVVDLAGNYRATRTLTICAGAGHDRVLIFEGVNASRYWIDGGRGPDKLGNSSPYIEEGFLEDLTLRGAGGDDKLFGGSFPDKIVAGGGGDRVEAGNGEDLVIGGGGGDRLFGEGHDDRLFGNEGDDLLDGDSAFYQPGTDRAAGGAGSDRCDAELERGCER